MTTISAAATAGLLVALMGMSTTSENEVVDLAPAAKAMDGVPSRLNLGLHPQPAPPRAAAKA